MAGIYFGKKKLHKMLCSVVNGVEALRDVNRGAYKKDSGGEWMDVWSAASDMKYQIYHEGSYLSVTVYRMDEEDRFVHVDRMRFLYNSYTGMMKKIYHEHPENTYKAG